MGISPPFSYRQRGGTLSVQDPTYAWRPADNELYQTLKSGDFCYVLTSRQMGKSSLRVRTMAQLQQDGIACAAIDLSAIGTQTTPEQWYRGFLYRLLRSFRLERTTNWKTWWEDYDFLSIVQRLDESIENILLTELSQDIVIFIDEIDSVLSLSFPADDFFAFIRACYNRRADTPAYQRLSFCILGVATPSQLITDKQRTPFNVGHSIQLSDLSLDNAKPALLPGLQNRFETPEAILSEILHWTGGQPFLTQKLCHLVVEKAQNSTPDVTSIVQNYIIENWEQQDEPEHLRTIRDRLIYQQQRSIPLLERYQEILQKEQVTAKNSPEELELQITGLISQRQGALTPSNPIYQRIFDQDWLNAQLASLWFLQADNQPLEDGSKIQWSKSYLTKNLILFIVLMVISAISLYISFRLFPGEARKQELHQYSDVIELARMGILLAYQIYFVHLIWKDEALEILQGSSKLSRRFKTFTQIACIVTLIVSLHHNFYRAPQFLIEKYPISGTEVTTLSHFREYYLSSILYFPYALIIHFGVSIPFAVVSAYATTKNLRSFSIDTKKLVEKVKASLSESNSWVSKSIKRLSIQRNFEQYSLSMVNMLSPYTSLLLAVGVINMFETKLGSKTLTEAGQDWMVFNYVASFLVVTIICSWIFRYYQHAFRVSYQGLVGLGDDHAQFLKSHSILSFFHKLVSSNLNLLLLMVLLLLNWLPF